VAGALRDNSLRGRVGTWPLSSFDYSYRLSVNFKEKFFLWEKSGINRTLAASASSPGPPSVSSAFGPPAKQEKCSAGALVFARTAEGGGSTHELFGSEKTLALGLWTLDFSGQLL
jgi:hypothetical protein